VRLHVALQLVDDHRKHAQNLRLPARQIHLYKDTTRICINASVYELNTLLIQVMVLPPRITTLTVPR
jgi:hypothetical protein